MLDNMQAANQAGQIRLGCPQDFASILPSVLSQFALWYPRMQIELFVEGSGPLADGLDKARIDLAVLIGHEDRAGAETVGQLDLVWIASPAFAPAEGQPIPLAVLGPQCVFR